MAEISSRFRGKRLAPLLAVYLLSNVVVILFGIIAVMGGAGGGGIDAETGEPVEREWWRAWLTIIGFGLISTGIAGLLTFFWVLLSDRWLEQLATFREFGLVTAHAERGAQLKEEYKARLYRARKRIDVLGFGLGSLREDFHEDFQRWAASAEVRILLIDPEFPDAHSNYADQRDREENDEPGTIAADVKSFKRAVESVQETFPEKFRVRLYRCLPAITIFRVDDEMYWGPYLMKTPSRNLPVFVVKRGGILFERLEAHFNAIWEDKSLSVPLEELKARPIPVQAANTHEKPDYGTEESKAGATGV